MRFRGALAVLVLTPVAAAACAPNVPRAESPRASALLASAASLPVDPTVRDVRFVPIAAREERSYGADPGGGVRSIEDGVRVVSLPGGATLTSSDRLPMAIDAPVVTALPERLGGGFLFVVDGTHVWRAESWLAPARPIFTSRASFLDSYGRVAGGIVPGLDRVYVFTGASLRSWQAIDGVTGKDVPQGPWPASPAVSAYAAIDGWRALAIADLRGAVETLDAGATWRAVRLPIDPQRVTVVGEAFEVSGTDAAGKEARYEVRGDGQATRVSATRSDVDAIDEQAAREPSGPLGANPLVAAVEDGWPAGNGTAIVARDGSLARVRLDDGSIAEIAPAAYALRPSRCHPVALGAPGGVGFVCGEAHGATILYAFDPARGRMDPVRAFDSPRAIVASGNGAIAVRGPCDAAAPGDDEARRYARYCVRSRDGAWREIRLEGAIGGERIVVLADGRLVILSPPQGNLAAAGITILDGKRVVHLPLAFAARTQPSVDVQRVLEVGVWLDGFEERRPGVLGGWIEAGGTMLGVEIDLEGRARFGQFIRDAGKTMVSGRYGLGWTSSLLGVETIDGGMTWTPLDVPTPLAVGRAVASRACGPIGCTAAGWLKIGWGRAHRDPIELPASHASTRRSAISLSLACDAVSDRSDHAAVDPLAAFPPPALSSDEDLVPNDANGVRVLAWGPKAGEWERVAKWTVRWVWPFGAASDARSTIASPAPPLLAAAVRVNAARALRWNMLAGDDPSHALLVTHRKQGEASLFELEAEHAPTEIERADGEPFGEIDAAIRAGGRWFITSPPRAGERTEAIVWQVDGSVAHELARIPRSSERAHAGLAWRGDGKAIALVVAGSPTAWPTRWVVPIDLETGALGDPDSLGAYDFGDRGLLPVCTSDDAGWSLDVPASFPIHASTRASDAHGASLSGTLDAATLGTPFARVRVTPTRACIERLTGSLEALPSDRATTRAPAAASLSVTLTSNSGRERRALRCSER